MNTTNQRIAIAEFCGWTEVHIITGKYSEHGNLGTVVGIVPDAEMMDSQGAIDKYFVVPNYPSDLNAMHEAEEKLGNLIYVYTMELIRILNWSAKKKPTFDLIHATAPQRAEAYVKTIGKWKD